MKASRWLSDWLRRRSRRERVVVSVGAAVSAAALAVALVVLPLAERWTTREATYAATRERWLRLQALVASEGRLRGALEQQQRAQRASSELLVTGPTPALAASSLQVLLQRYAEESLVELTRIDVAGQPKPEGPGLLAIPVVLQAQGDVFGLVDFLYRLQHGRRLFVIDEITVSARPAWRADSRGGDALLTWSLRGYGLYSAPPGGT